MVWYHCSVVMGLNDRRCSGLEMKKKTIRKPAVYLQHWGLRDCEPEIRKFEIDWGYHVNDSKKYKGFSLWIGSVYFGALDFTFVDNEIGFLKEYKEDTLWVGKKLL